MKKIICIFIICILILTGCGNNSQEKLLRMECYSARDGKLITAVEDQETIDRILEFDDGEKIEQLPDGLIPEYKMLIYQETTLLFGQDPDEERDYVLIETLVTYQDSSYISETISGDIVLNIISEEQMTFYYVMPDEVRDELDETINQG